MMLRKDVNDRRQAGKKKTSKDRIIVFLFEPF
jgi:hypothetical protein